MWYELSADVGLMPQKWDHPTTDDTDTDGELIYQQRRLKCNRVRPSNAKSQKNNSPETSETEEENPENPIKVETP